MDLTVDTSGEIKRLQIPARQRLSTQFVQRFLQSNDLIADAVPGFPNVYFIYARDALLRGYPLNRRAATLVGSLLHGNVVVLEAEHVPIEFSKQETR